jgi:hypothetical protein
MVNAQRSTRLRQAYGPAGIRRSTVLPFRTKSPAKLQLHAKAGVMAGKFKYVSTAFILSLID